MSSVSLHSLFTVKRRLRESKALLTSVDNTDTSCLLSTACFQSSISIYKQGYHLCKQFGNNKWPPWKCNYLSSLYMVYTDSFLNRYIKKNAFSGVRKSFASTIKIYLETLLGTVSKYYVFAAFFKDAPFQLVYAEDKGQGLAKSKQKYAWTAQTNTQSS